MANPATKTLTYRAALALIHGPALHPYDSIDILATSESEAIAKALKWSRDPNREVVPETYLVVKIDGRSIHNEKLS
jgi:hypothetical protein